MNHDPELVIHPTDFPVYLKARMAGKTVAEFAKELGISREGLYKLLKRERQPSAKLLAKLGGDVYYGFNRPEPTTGSPIKPKKSPAKPPASEEV